MKKRKLRNLHHLASNMKLNKELKSSFNYVFQFLLITYLFLLLINEFKKITFINLNYLMISVILFGVLTVLFPIKVKKEKFKEYEKIIKLENENLQQVSHTSSNHT